MKLASDKLLESLEYIEAPSSFDGSEGLLALIIKTGFQVQPGRIRFLTAPILPQQVGLASWPKGHVIDPHIHRVLPRMVSLTQEVLLVRKGFIRLDFYTSAKAYFCSRVLGPGDVVILLHGGHGLTMLEDSEFFEIKQGPYMGKDNDKIMF